MVTEVVAGNTEAVITLHMGLRTDECLCLEGKGYVKRTLPIAASILHHYCDDITCHITHSPQLCPRLSILYTFSSFILLPGFWLEKLEILYVKFITNVKSYDEICYFCMIKKYLFI